MLYREWFFFKGFPTQGFTSLCHCIIHPLQQPNTRFLKTSADMPALWLSNLRACSIQGTCLYIQSWPSIPSLQLFKIFQKLLILLWCTCSPRTASDSLYKLSNSKLIFTYDLNLFQNSGLKKQINWLWHLIICSLLNQISKYSHYNPPQNRTGLEIVIQNRADRSKWTPQENNLIQLCSSHNFVKSSDLEEDNTCTELALIKQHFYNLQSKAYKEGLLVRKRAFFAEKLQVLLN